DAARGLRCPDAPGRPADRLRILRGGTEPAPLLRPAPSPLVPGLRLEPPAARDGRRPGPGRRPVAFPGLDPPLKTLGLPRAGSLDTISPGFARPAVGRRRCGADALHVAACLLAVGERAGSERHGAEGRPRCARPRGL